VCVSFECGECACYPQPGEGLVVVERTATREGERAEKAIIDVCVVSLVSFASWKLSKTLTD